VGEALLWGLVSASSLIVGGFVAMRFDISSRALGWIMAFGAGVLISAVAFELVEEAFETSLGESGVGFGLLAGSLVYFGGDMLLDRAGGADRKHSGGKQAEGSALAIVLGIVLDGVPESLVLGLTVLQSGTVSMAMLIAVVLSNLPEAIAATSGLLQSGWTRMRITGLWTLVTVVSGIASLLGYVLFDTASAGAVAFVLSFAAGAILTMLADTMMPEAFEHGGKLVGVLTTIGFAVSFWVTTLE
jgi:ZIP family zinc transporter